MCAVKEKLKEVMEETQLTRMLRYSVKDTYKQMVGVHARVHWDKMVWCRMVTPKHRFFLWLVMQNRMQTSGRLYAYGISEHPRCLICDNEEETQEHLFFRCCYGAEILQRIKTWLKWETTCTSVPGLLREIARSRVSRFKKHVYATSVAAMVYHVWWARNEVFWNQKVIATSVMSHRVQLNVIERAHCSYAKKRAQADRTWIRELSLDVCK